MKTRLVFRLITALCLGLFWAGLTAMVGRFFVPAIIPAVPWVFGIAGVLSMFGLSIVDGCGEEAEG